MLVVLAAFAPLASADTTPPYTIGNHPAKGATGVLPGTNIIVHVIDDGDGVDESTIEMTVNGNTVTPSIEGSANHYILTYDPPTDFDYLQVVDVTVNASDLSSPPNYMSDSYSFTIKEDTSPSGTMAGCPCVTKHKGIGNVESYWNQCGEYPGNTYYDEEGNRFQYITCEFTDVPSNIILAKVHSLNWGGTPGCGDGFNITIDNSQGHHASPNYNAWDPCNNGPCSEPCAYNCRCDILNWPPNENDPDTTDVCYVDVTGCGRTYFWYNATPYIVPGSNTITMRQRNASVDLGGHGWGPAYGLLFTGLNVLYEDESLPEVQYFVNEGTQCQASGGCEDADTVLINLDGHVYTASACKVSITRPGSSSNPQLNGHEVPDWDNIPPSYLMPSNNLLYDYNPNTGGSYERTRNVRAWIELDRSDLNVTNISNQTLYAKYYNTINATVLNNIGNVSSNTTGFNVTLYADDTKIDAQHVTNISAGESKEVSFTWKPDYEGSYVLSVLADIENVALETDETNNLKTKTVNVTTAPGPLWQSQSSNVSSIPVGGAIELRARGNSSVGLDYAVLHTDETGTWKECTDYGSPMVMGSLDSFSFTHTSDTDWNNQTMENLSVSKDNVTLLWVEDNNIALNKPASASSWRPTRPPEYGNDGNDGTFWESEEHSEWGWWQVDLEEISNVVKIRIVSLGHGEEWEPC